MKVTVLVENTSSCDELQCEHGLSLYIETSKHKILFDMGQSDAFIRNALKLGIDLSKVDIAFLSHGHNDHGGGLQAFLQMNHHALVYCNSNSFLQHFNGVKKEISLDQSLQNHPQIHYINDDLLIDDEITIKTSNNKKYLTPVNQAPLYVKEGHTYLLDDYRHEHYLLITQDDKTILFSGCSHKGVINILSWFEPTILVGGFHYSKLEQCALEECCRQLQNYSTQYYTCHCTGIKQYDYLKKQMKGQIEYVSTGDTIIL